MAATPTLNRANNIVANDPIISDNDRNARAGGAGTGGADPGGATGGGGAGTGGAVTTRAGGAGGATTQQQPTVLRHLLSLPPAITEFPVAGTTPLLLFPLPDQSQPQLLSHSPLLAPAPYTTVAKSLTKSREPASRPLMPVRTRRAARPCRPPVQGTHIMALHPSSVPQPIVMPLPPTSSLPHVPDPESYLVRAVSLTVTRLLATVVTDPAFLSPIASALVDELVDFAAMCRLDYAASLVFDSSCPLSGGGELALGYDVLDDRQFELECPAAAAPRLASTLLCTEGDPDALDISTPHSYADAITAQHDYELHSSTSRQLSCRATFTRLSGCAALVASLDTSLPPFYILVYVDDLVFATADTEALALVKAELQERHTCTDLGELRSYLGLQITRDRARRTITLIESHIVQQVLQRFGFWWSSPQTTLPTGQSLSAPPSDESVEPSGPYGELVGCLVYLMTCTRPDLTYPLSLLARYVAPDASWADNQTIHRSTQGYSFSLSTGSVLVPLADLPADRLGKKHIALRYFLTPELHQCGQLRLAYVASQANTADVFTKAIGSGDHQRFCSAPGLVPTLPHLLVS
ncbi:unnamed protein product [Closterium sp. NIES-53]